MFLTLSLLTSLSCGKRKPPLPPRERVAQRVEIDGFQRGNQVLLSWKMPARNAPAKSLLHISRVDIYRLAEPANAPLVLSEEEFASRSVQIASVPISDADFGMKTMTYNDTLQFAGQPVRLRYGVRLVNASGQKAAFSNFLLIEPAATVAAAPANLSTTLSQDAITLQWTAPAQNINGTSPVNLLGYDIYRSESDKQAGKLLNKTPVTDTKFADGFFEFGKNYYYFVRAVSVGSGGIPVESQESNIVNIRPVDTFPPSPPAAITLAAAPNNISIFFAVNPEKDIAGYKIYRSTDPDQDKSQWALLTPQLLPTNTFQDAKIESGRTYYYYITATDKAGNVSEPSEVVKETAP
ncbi:MAG TPA: hypothetical protein VL325_06490 [Pyrinomonadaceae bacterium]|nr:hypothetical protein [Pyrinomonadaceae bacterium]